MIITKQMIILANLKENVGFLEWFINYINKPTEHIELLKLYHEQKNILLKYLWLDEWLLLTFKLTGMAKGWYDDGQLWTETPYHNGKISGCCKSYYPNGKQRSKTHCLNDERHGLLSWWHDNGQNWLYCKYVHGQLHGQLSKWNYSGALIQPKTSIRTIPTRQTKNVCINL